DRPGAIYAVTAVIEDERLNIQKLTIQAAVNGTGTGRITLAVQSVQQLADLLRRIQGLESVLDARRVTPAFTRFSEKRSERERLNKRDRHQQQATPKAA
ncbi:MAG: hypothetical protein QHJ73_07870, partial [Armatimonadota bacterium]|nr:hypothetical protein [Armatimonadota bacterium]